MSKMKRQPFVSAQLTLLLLCLLFPVAVQAHGGGKVQLTDVPAGPYHLFVWTSPEPWRVGQAHTTVAVTKPLGNGQEMPVEDAEVVVTYAPAGAASAAQAVQAVEQGGTQPGFYEADAVVTTVGVWAIGVAVQGPEGRGAVAFTYEVLPAEGVNWLPFAAAAAVVLVAALAFWLLRTRRPAPGMAGHVAGSQS